MVAEHSCKTTRIVEQMDVPVPQDVKQIIGVLVVVRQQMPLNGRWVTAAGDDAEYIKKLFASVAQRHER